MTYIPNYLDVSNLKSAKLARFLQLWTNTDFGSARQLPSGNNAFGRMSDDLIVVDVKHSGKKYFIEFMGKNVREHFGADATGVYLEDFSESTLKILMQKAFDDICESKSPYCGKRNDLVDYLLLRYEVLILPLIVAPSREVSAILLAFDFATKDADRFRSISSQIIRDVSNIKSSVLRSLVSKHHAVAAEADAPYFSAFNSSNLSPFEHDIVQLSVSSSPLRFIIEYTGSNIRSMLGYDPTHKAVDEIEDVELGKLYHLSFQTVLYKRQRLWMQFQRPVGPDWVDIEIVMLPVRNNANEISHIIAGAVFSKNENSAGK